jgi:hypothetical protein
LLFFVSNSRNLATFWIRIVKLKCFTARLLGADVRRTNSIATQEKTMSFTRIIALVNSINLRAFAFLAVILCSLAITAPASAQQAENRVKFLNYPDCVELKNETTRVVLGHHIGGRLLAYELNGKNVLYLSPEEAEWNPANPSGKTPNSAGRFDVGPEFIQLRGNALWTGRWQAESLGPRRAKLTSMKDPKSGFVITREFTLAKNSSRLTVKQTVHNQSENTNRHCYWSRTFATHGGTAIVPITPETSRFPNFYFMARSPRAVDFMPKDPNVRLVDNYLLVEGPTEHPKLGMDSTAGWVAYQTRQNQLFVKRYPVYQNHSYGEATGINLSIWYPPKEKLNACEIEPIGPMETLKPGEQASFTVDWWLFENPYPQEGSVDPISIAKIVEDRCQATK